MPRRVLVTGGAGFIGSHVCDELLRHGYRVRALDALVPQVHGAQRKRPAYLAPDVELVTGDVRDPDAVARSLDGVDVVMHFAALVGVGQSMYQLAEYTSVNGVGTAVLLEALSKRPVQRLVVASSMSIYGEGLCRTPSGACVAPRGRPFEQLKTGDWEVRGEAGEVLSPLPTPEWKTPALESVYALSTYDQERLALMVGRAYGIPTVALRLFNVYGPRQALSNPYTGVLANFAARLLNERRPLVFEDGLQRRDFVSVHDVARACRLAVEAEKAPGNVLNVGSGRSLSIVDAAKGIARALGKAIAPEITGKYRVGDIRHCFSDPSLAKSVLGYSARVSFETGIVEFAHHLAQSSDAATDRVAEAQRELETRGLTL
jgi:dTDP-L-rhamnose 4-epimerase